MTNTITKCKCRTCGAVYAEEKSRADIKGYCSLKCQHIQARVFGYSKQRADQDQKNSPMQWGNHSEYRVLKDAGQIGSIYV